MKKSEHMPVWLRKLVFLLHVCSVSWGGWYKRAAKVVHLVEKSVINMMWLLVPVFDWWLMMIGPGGLLLVVPICLQSPFQFNEWGCKKVGNYTWMWEIVFWRVAYSAQVGMLIVFRFVEHSYLSFLCKFGQKSQKVWGREMV
jgi:hypothetical protein